MRGLDRFTTFIRPLKRTGFEMTKIDNLQGEERFIYKLKRKFYRKFFDKNYLFEREIALAKAYSHQIEKVISELNPDIVFSPGTLPVAFLNTKKPMIFWTDATFAGMINYYPEFSNLCKETIRNGNMIEQEALSRCGLAIYPSEWAAESAIRNYDVNSARVKVVPFGANIDTARNLNDIKTIVDKKNYKKCRLLFIGVDWNRKGGDVALETTRLLNNNGLPAELHVVGCIPPMEVPDFVKIHGFISKRTDEGKKLIDKLFSESHFFILPSKAECFGVVFAEASSFGLPSLATNTGGIPSAITDGINGKLFPANADAEKYSSYILEIMSSKNKYYQLAMNSFEEYNSRLNWSKSAAIIKDYVLNLKNKLEQ